MARLTVKNIGPIREAELEVKKHTVFIGPQGTGKSTLAKLIAIANNREVRHEKEKINELTEDLLFNRYNMVGYFNDNSTLMYKGSLPVFKNNSLDIVKNPEDIINEIKQIVNNINVHNASDIIKKTLVLTDQLNMLDDEDNKLINQVAKFYKISENIKQRRSAVDKLMAEYDSIYVPSERTLTATLSNAIWSLFDADVNLPKFITLFGNMFEEARNSLNHLNVPFLNIQYQRTDGQDLIKHQLDQTINLFQSATGYQSIIPLLVVIEYQRRQGRYQFVIEEPELSLYPIAQKELIYNLISGLDPNVTYQDAEWVITTHSPYILSSFNTLMLAYKVAQRSDELRVEVEKIIPAQCWINPDEFAAYYVDNGTVESITNSETGLINDSRLDDVSEDFAGEQDLLFSLLRSARVHD